MKWEAGNLLRATSSLYAQGFFFSGKGLTCNSWNITHHVWNNRVTAGSSAVKSYEVQLVWRNEAGGRTQIALWIIIFHPLVFSRYPMISYHALKKLWALGLLQSLKDYCNCEFNQKKFWGTIFPPKDFKIKSVSALYGLFKAIHHNI